MTSQVVCLMCTILWDVGFLKLSIKKRWKLSLSQRESPINVRFAFQFTIKAYCYKRSILPISSVMIRLLWN